jgi:7,8-dihydropterin-6-yl-methyl-4-(beta-D-ribofuranosyl)aminobenzene 5'-phosphate synthase
MIIQVLIDNAPSDDLMLKPEHGLSFYIETEGNRILCDMGASGMFLGNAKQMGIDLACIDLAFVSHGHADHTGGLLEYLDTFEHSDVYLSNRVFEAEYFSSRRGMKRNISTQASISKIYQNRLCFVCESTWITPFIAAVYTDIHDYSQPYGNRFLTKVVGNEETMDDFRHELSLAIQTPKGLVIVSSCSHGGAVNIMKSCCKFTGEDTVFAFIGGLHLVDSEYMPQEVQALSEELLNNYPAVQIYTGHCTCDAAKEALKEKGLNIHFFQTGYRIVLP